MWNKGGRKMQAISNKYCSNVQRKDCKASDRFDIRVEIARGVSRNVSALNSELCNDLLKKTLKGIYGKDKR